MIDVTHINEQEAKAIRAELLEAVGTENVPQQWSIFMRTVRQHMPDILGRGRPSRDAIERSPIGALGFKSWREMIDTPSAAGGLGLGWSKWREWSRAWKVIAGTDLEEAPITAPEVNGMAQKAKDAGEEMPTTWEAWQDLKERYSAAKSEERAQSQAAQAARIEELEKEVERLKSQYRQKIAQSRQLVRKSQGERDEARRALQQALEKSKPPVQRQMTKWQHFLAVLGLC